MSLLPLLSALALHAAPAVPADFEPYVREALGTWNVPGAAVAILKDGRPLLLSGYGLREVGKADPVTARTPFPIASLTKGFTAAAVAMLVEQGRVGWDDPVVKHLPAFAVADPDVTRSLTVRDVVAHRSGLSDGADFLWYGTSYDRAEIIRRLRFLEQGSPLRSTYSYQNVTYLLLGALIAQQSGLKWEDFVRQRLLGPLKMDDATTSLAALKAKKGFAVPHSDASGKPVPQPFFDADNIAPAAALNASATDLSRWMRVLLEGGALDGQRILSAETVEAIFTPQTLINLGPAARKLYPESHFEAYGLGWVLQDYRGRQVAWNTGGLDGVSCSIALVREEGLGIAVLTNGGRTSLPEALVFRALDDLLGAPAKKDWSKIRHELSLGHRARAEKARAEQEAKRVAGTRPSLPKERYLGSYQHPLFGTLALSDKKGQLAATLAGHGGKAEHWHYDTWRIKWDLEGLGTTLVAFQLDAEGKPTRAALEDMGEFTRLP